MLKKLLNLSTFSLSFLIISILSFSLPDRTSAITAYFSIIIGCVSIVLFLTSIITVNLIKWHKTNSKSKERIFKYDNYECEDSNVWNFLFASISSVFTIINGNINLTTTFIMILIYLFASVLPSAYLYNPIPLIFKMHYYKISERNGEVIHVLSKESIEGNIQEKSLNFNQIHVYRVCEGFYIANKEEE